MGNSLAVQWLGLCAFTAEGLGSIPGWETKFLQATRHSQKKKKRWSDDPELGGVMVNFMCQLNRLRDAQRADKTFLLGVSMRVFLEELNI